MPKNRREDTYNRIEKVITKLLFSQPFFGSMALNLKSQPANIPTAAVGPDGEFYYNEEWFSRLQDWELTFVMMHEIMHLVLRHFGRRNGRLPFMRWNAAIDYEVNGLLAKELTAPKWCLNDKSFEDMIAETIYNKIKTKTINIALQFDTHPQDQRTQDLKNAAAAASSDSGKGKKKKDKGKGEGKGKSSGGSSEKDSGKDGDKELPTPSWGEEDYEANEQMWYEKAVMAAEAAKMQGHEPAFMERVYDLLEVKLPYDLFLKECIMRVVRNDFTWTRPIYYGKFALPRLRGYACKIALGLDTSGSIGQNELNVFLSILQEMLDHKYVDEIIAISCDARVHDAETFRHGERINFEARGGGGTNFCPVFEEIAENYRDIDGLIFLTDGWGDFPDSAPQSYPVIWVLTPESLDPNEVPFGKTYKLKELPGADRE